MKKLIQSCLLLLVANLVHGQYKILQIGARSVGSPEVKLKLVARLQGYNSTPTNPTDFYDVAIYSPKSALILEKIINGKSVKKLYINSLEGGQTVVYDMNNSLKKIAVINHTFTAADSGPVQGNQLPGILL